nr:hypothetical protein [Caldicoprobacter algeriensis]
MPLYVAVTTACPTALPVITPLEFTVTIVVLLEVYCACVVTSSVLR